MANQYSADVPKGFNVPKQVRLDSITGIQNENTLKNLGSGNNLAFKYYEGLKVYCKDEKTEYVWRQVVGVETGLLTTHFVYPTYTAVDGINYSGKSFNFFLVTNSGTPANGSETKINSGTNTTVTGLGTIASPYVINSTDTIANGSETKINEGDNINITGNGTQLTPYVINADLTDLGIVKTVGNEVIAPGQTLSIINGETTGKVLTTKEYVQSVIPAVPNGSETKVFAGTNTTVTGIGTTGNPYVINSVLTEKEIVSSTLIVTEDVSNIYIELPIVSETPTFIVNSDSTEEEETGSPSKPFKNLQNALDAYVGNGVSNKVPENIGTVIIIQKDVNTFTGSLAYVGLNLSIENTATLVSNPSSGTFLLDVDVEATLPTNPNYSMLPFGNAESCDISITVKRGGAIQLQREGFKNRGNTLNTGNSSGKIIRVFGDSSGIYKTAEASVVSPSTQRIFSLNADNQSGFFNDGAEAHVFLNTLSVHSFNSQIAYVGLNTKLRIDTSTTQFGLSGTPFNIGTVPFQINGGMLTVEDSRFTNPLLLTNLISLKTQGSTGSVFNGVNSEIGDSCDYIFANLDTGTTTLNQLILDKCSNYTTQVEAFVKSFMSSNLWNINLTNCNINTWNTNETKIALIPSSLNTLSRQVVITVSEYTSKTAAVTAGLFNGSMFINKKTITAGTFVIGEEYKILTIGSTNYTLIGASANTVGLYFIASGVGTGTGTASLIKLDIII